MATTSGCVVVGVDGTAASARALRVGARLARESGRPLVGVLAWTPTAVLFGHGSGVRLHACERAAMARLDRTRDEALGRTPDPSADDSSWTPFVVRGRTGRVLLEVADAPEDVLVLGADGPFGRVARYCLAHARCSVVTVPTDAAATAPCSPATGAPARR